MRIQKNIKRKQRARHFSLNYTEKYHILTQNYNNITLHLEVGVEISIVEGGFSLVHNFFYKFHLLS